MTTTDTTSSRGFTIVRRFDAPRERVFRAWTDPAHLGWFFSDPTAANDPIELDLRVGGQWRQRMVVSAGEDYVTGGVYREIDPPTRLVFSWGAVGGWPELSLADLDASPLVTVELAPVDDGTEMTFTLALPESLSDADVRGWFDLGIRAGWTETVDRLAV